MLVNISDEEQRYLLAQNEAALRMSLERVGLKDEHDRIKDIRETSEVRRAQADMFDAEPSVTTGPRVSSIRVLVHRRTMTRHLPASIPRRLVRICPEFNAQSGPGYRASACGA